MRYYYTATNLKGDERKGVLEASDRIDLGRQLQKDGYILVSHEEERARLRFSLPIPILRPVGTAEKMIFARNLSALISAGIPLARALETLERQTGHKRFRSVLIGVGESVRKGTTLSASIAAHPRVFPDLFVAMVKVGEESGTLAESLMLISAQLAREHELKKRIRGAMIYPLIVVIAMVGVGILMMIFVVPSLVATFEELHVELPLTTRIIIGLSGFMSGHPILTFTLLALAGGGIARGVRSPGGREIIGALLLHAPVFGRLQKEIQSARIARTLASLLGGGVSVLDALAITRDVLPYRRYKMVIDAAREAIEKGRTLSSAFIKSEVLFPPLVGEMMVAGEESGSLPSMLTRLADFYEGEVEAATKNLATIIEPVLFLLIGAAVGFFAISMITPMYTVLNNV